MSSIQFFSNQPFPFAEDRSHIQMDKKPHRFSKIKSNALSSKQKNGLDTPKIYQETHSLADQAQVTAGVAKKRLKLSAVSGLSNSWHTNSEVFVDSSKAQFTSKAGQIKPFFPDQDIADRARALFIETSGIFTELDPHVKEDSGIASLNSSSHFIDRNKEPEIEPLFPAQDIALFLEDQARKLLIGTSYISTELDTSANENFDTATLNSSSNLIERNNDQAANKYEVIIDSLWKTEGTKWRLRNYAQMRRAQLKMNPTTKKESQEKNKARYQKLKKMRQENPLEGERFTEQTRLARKKRLEKVKADPELFQKYRTTITEYKQKYRAKLKNDPEQKARAAKVKEQARLSAKKYSEKVKADPALSKKRKEKLKGYLASSRKRLKSNLRNSARCVEKQLVLSQEISK